MISVLEFWSKLEGLRCPTASVLFFLDELQDVEGIFEGSHVERAERGTGHASTLVAGAGLRFSELGIFSGVFGKIERLRRKRFL